MHTDASTPCGVCGRPLESCQAHLELSPGNEICVCHGCGELDLSEPVNHRMVAILNAAVRVTAANMDGLHAVGHKVRALARIDVDEVSPELGRAAACWLALRGRRSACFLGGIRGGQAVVVSSYEPEVVAARRRRILGERSAQATPIHRDRLVAIFERDGTEEMRAWMAGAGRSVIRDDVVRV